MDWGCRTVSLLLALSIMLASIHQGDADRKIVCYYTNWSIYRPGTAKFSPQNINPYLCTHLIYAFGGFTKDNALKPFDKYQDIEKGGYAKFTGLKTYNKNLKTLLAIGGWNEGSSRFSPMVADPDRRREFVKNSVKFLRKNHFDGLDLDWEYPAFRDGGKPRDRDNYASLVQELREEFEKESSKTGRPRLLLSLAMPAGIEYIDKGYDVPRLNEYLDFINLLSYDYHSSYEPAVNHHSPLYPLEEDNEYNYDSELTIDYTINYLLKKGASPEKIILGIPTYGRSYTLFNQDATDLGSPADGPGIEGDATREKGYLAYYEICDSLSRSDDWEVVQPNPKAMGPYAFKEDQWVGYDDEDIVKLKAKYANDKNLGGIMFWTIDNDDFRGKCHERPYPLIEAAKETLLTDSTNAKSKPVDSRKKPRLPTVQSNSVARRQGTSGRRSTTTAAPVSKKRLTPPRPKFRTYARSKTSKEEEEEDQEVDRRSYNQSSEEENDSDGGNVVKTAEKNDRSREKTKSRPKTRSSSRNRRKQNRRKEEKDDSEEAPISNKLTTPEPPTTPDPGSDFKCEDEGFFPHPRDCKKYFWCLDSGPGGLGVVAHQFTCPSGLVFNKAADSCDYPRNVICPKSKTSQTAASTTRAPITAATSRTTYLYSTTRKPTTEKPEEEEYDEEYEDEDELEEEEPVKEKKEPSTTTTPKTLLYKTITRNKPSTTTTTTTTTATPQVTRKFESSEESVKILGTEDEEDPKVIKELIKLIKKAGGIEELEKQLYLQGKSSGETSADTERATPATISRSLYERVLSRQNVKVTSRTSGATSYANGPGGAQFEGLDEVPEVRSLRRSQKPQYVTIERPRPSTKEPPVEEDEDDADNEELEEDIADVASSEEQTVSNPFLTSSIQRVTPNYINIRRARPSTTTSRNENDVVAKDEEEEEPPVRSRRPTTSSRSTESISSEDKGEDSRNSNEDNPTTKSRYVSIQRFRSTTSRPIAEVSESSTSPDPVTQAAPTEKEEEKLQTSTTAASTSSSSTTIATTASSAVVVDEDTERSTAKTSLEPTSSSTTEAVRLVEESATEILLTTAPAGLSSTVSQVSSSTLPSTQPSTLTSPSSRSSSAATVAQPRPFGHSRRTRPTTESPTTPLPGSKVAGSEAIRLPTLKELIGPRTIDRPDNASPVHLSLFDKETNLVLEGNDSSDLPREVQAPQNPGYDRDGWILAKTKQGELDPIEDKVRLYYDEENSADDAESSLASKKRIDREDSTTTTTIRPTTMRGAPFTRIPKDQAPRGFYVTRGETEASVTETDTFATEPTTLSFEEDAKSTEIATTLKTETTMPRRRTTVKPTTQSPTDNATKETVRTRGKHRHRVKGTTPKPTSESSTTSTTPKASSTTPTSPTASSLKSFLPTLAITSTVESTIDPTTIFEPAITSGSLNDLSSTSTEREQTPTDSSTTTENPATEALTETPATLEEPEESTAKVQSTDAQTTVTIATTLPTTSTTSTQKPGPAARGTQRFNSHEFGRRGHRDRSKTPIEENLVKVKRTQQRRLYRGRQRKPLDSVPEETAPKDSRSEFSKNAEEQVGVEDSVGRSEPEVNSTRSTVAPPRTPGSPSTNRFRKPTGFTLAPSRNKPQTAITNPPSNISKDGIDKIGVTENVSETAKPEKDIDQSSRAQEIAVTLAEPPQPQTSATGRPSLRDALRRRISTTLAPRTDSTTPRTAVSFAVTLKDRQKPKTQDKPKQNTTSRPRRPQVIDYDYYEDEEESVVGKSTFNGKLLLTNQGSIRCLDQGNFPHPYSCKKFIVCARMQNGLVVGAEYTCPDKLSYDPVGGICNWSAGLGCKE